MVENISSVAAYSAPQKTLKVKNTIPHNVSFKAQEDKIELSDKAQTAKTEDKSFNKNWLYGLGALAIALGGYFALKGKGGDDVAKKGSEIADNVFKAGKDNAIELTPELKYFKKLEANIPVFPKAGEKPIETILKDGGKRIDLFDRNLANDVSRYYDKNGVLHREIYFSGGSVEYISINNKAGKPLKEVVNNYDGTTLSLKYKYNESGQISSIVKSNGEIQNFKYYPIVYGDNEKKIGQTVSKKIYKDGKSLPENIVKSITTKTDEIGEIRKRSVADYVSNTLSTEDFSTGIKQIYVTKDGVPYSSNMRVSTGELVLSKTIEPFTANDGQKMVKITNAADGKVEEITFEKYCVEHFFDD